jgi:very-long-chain enoyl-CoA reductase
VKDTQKLSELNVDKSGKIYFKDLGPQIGWSTVNIFLVLFFKKILLFQVFMAEYAGPLFIYLLFYIRPSIIYGSISSSKPMHLAAQFVEFI